MSVGINGICRLNANDYREINIKQEDIDDYRVDVVGDRIGKFNRDFSNSLRGMSNNEKIEIIIDRYLDSFKIYGITKLIELTYKDGLWVVVYGNDCDRILKLQLFDKCFNDIFYKIKNKYLNDRYSFFWNNANDLFKLDISNDCSRYGIDFIECDECDKEIECDYENYECNKYVNINVMLDKDGNVVDFDKEFIKEFLLYRFNLYCDEVEILDIKYDWDNSFNPKVKEHIIKCGDFELIFLHKDELMFILDIVNEYNRELFEINNNIKKRQLKMEGF